MTSLGKPHRHRPQLQPDRRHREHGGRQLDVLARAFVRLFCLQLQVPDLQQGQGAAQAHFQHGAGGTRGQRVAEALVGGQAYFRLDPLAERHGRAFEMQLLSQMAQPRLEHQGQRGVERAIQPGRRAALQQAGTEGVGQQHRAAESDGRGRRIEADLAD
ncbi:hypothetical protein D3C76_1362170 [compost metagenome]